MSSRTVLSEVKGFTPLLDSLVSKYDITTAAVWGRVWRYCQMENGVCQASIKKIAGELSLDRKTIMRHIEKLVADGYLEDRSPDLVNRPHTLIDTGKAGVYSTIYANEKAINNDGDTNSTVPEKDSRNNGSGSTVPQRDSSVPEKDSGCTTKGQPTVPQRDMKRVFKKESKTQIIDRPIEIALEEVRSQSVPVELSVDEKVIDMVLNRIGPGSDQSRRLSRETVENLMVLSADLDTNSFVFQADNQYLMNFCAQRLSRYFEQAIVGVTGKPGSVVFVSAEAVEA